MDEAPLAGVKVVELAQLIAGPSAALLLADYGATVVKIEPPSGDASRELRSVAGGGAAEAPTFLAYNRDKRLVRLDLRTEAGRAAALAEIADADVVIESSRPGAMERLGLGAEALRARWPGLVYASVSGFGSSGADAGRRGVDLVIQAESGIMALTGFPDGPPTKVGFTVVDAATAHALCHGVLAALLRRARTGRGGVVQVSLLDVAVHLQAAPMMEYLVSGVEPQRVGNTAPMTAPASVYPCADGDLVLSAYVESHWEALASVLELPSLLTDERFRTKASRVANRAALDALLAARFATGTRDEWLQRLSAAGLVAGQVRSVAEVARSSPLVTPTAIHTPVHLT